MGIKINCKSNDGLYCKDKRIKRTRFGLGHRLCCEVDGDPCPFKERYSKPKGHPAPQH